ECSGMISAHCSLHLPASGVAGITGACYHTQLCPGCLELLTISD
ncbi:zinc finger matrin-type protein 1-like, partial [Hylobates moloch]